MRGDEVSRPPRLWQTARLTEKSEREIATVQATSESKVAALHATSESEQRHAAAAASSWVFNWRADGWGGGDFFSEVHAFGEGVTVNCAIKSSFKIQCSHFIGFVIKGRAECRVHATFSIVDKHDTILLKISEVGTAAAPRAVDFTRGRFRGLDFDPTADQKEQSVRADGSIRMRAEVRLFLD